MKRLICSLSALALALASCAAPAGGNPQAPAGPGPTPSAAPGRQALILQVENQVEARPTGANGYDPAVIGQVLGIGGAARTYDESRARLDLAPDGTIVRLGPNTFFELVELGDDPENPFTLLDLLDGKLWILLIGGELEVRTEVGSAAVRGSMLGVAYDAASKRLSVTCLEGHCAIRNENGSVDLAGGQASGVPGPGQPPEAPRPMTAEEKDEWLAENPEAAGVLAGAGSPRPGGPGLPGPGPAATPTYGPLKYTLTNNCPNGGVWHWQFVGQQTYAVDVPAGQTVTGELPPDLYIVTDFFDNGISHGPNPAPGGGHLQVQSCPAQ